MESDNHKPSALILEGGGLRGVFTSGVLEAFLEAGIVFDEVYGVSAGASNAVTFLARQKGRNKRVFIDYIHDPRYKGFKSWILTGNYFNKTFIFEEIPNRLDPFDFATFAAQPAKLTMPVTHAQTGETHFLRDFSSPEAITTALKAATSLPILSRPEPIGNELYFDGGISCPLIWNTIDLSKYRNVIYVLTQPKGYQKTPSKNKWLQSIMLLKHPKIIEALNVRHKVYNETLEAINRAEEMNDHLMVIRPNGEVSVSRTESNKEKMHLSYQNGYDIANALIQERRLSK